jgi:D-arabinose 1-dehydrogenase-like Zn-dependent alcohol dehydrogenase
MAGTPYAEDEGSGGESHWCSPTAKERIKIMRGAVLYGPRDVRFEEREAPKIIKSTDALIRVSATCVCGSDLWLYRGINAVPQPSPMGHEYCGIVVATRDVPSEDLVPSLLTLSDVMGTGWFAADAAECEDRLDCRSRR